MPTLLKTVLEVKGKNNRPVYVVEGRLLFSQLAISWHPNGPCRLWQIGLLSDLGLWCQFSPQLCQGVASDLLSQP